MNLVKQHLHGLIAAPFTPMHEDGSLNTALIPTYYQMLKINGVTGAFICGSTGEGVSMTTAEKMQVADAWASCTKYDTDFKLMTLVGGTSIADCKELARHAKDIGLYAVSFTAPFYFKPSDVEQLAECCKAIADEVPGMPFYYYHIPVLTGVDFPMFDLLKAVDELHLNGIAVFTTGMNDSLPVYELNYKDPCCIIMGGEEKGVQGYLKKPLTSG